MNPIDEPKKPVIATLGVMDAQKGKFTSTIVTSIKLTRRYIWVLKLRNIWSIIRADVFKESHNDKTDHPIVTRYKG
jgi:hypothetical protein